MKTKTTTKVERMKKARGYLRVAAYLGVLALVLCAVSIRSARAEVAEQALAMGRQMAMLAGAEGETTRVLVNGQAVLVGSTVSSDATSLVLDRFEDHCKKNLAQTSDSWRSALTKRDRESEPQSEASAFETGVLRTGTDDGIIVCFTRTPGSKASVQEALDSFGRTGDLNAFGALRFAYAKPTSNGQTHVLTVWTEEGFDFRKIMFEEGKDVAGEDFAEVPRLPSSTRMMATRIDGAPYGMNVYVTPMPIADVTAFYDHAMSEAGWGVLDPHLEEGAGRSYERDGIVLTMHVSNEDGKTFVGLGLAGVAARDAK
jgi:hypothetical protein